MKIAVLLVALCAVSSAKTFYPFGKSPLVDFTPKDAIHCVDGVLDGLEVNPDSPGPFRRHQINQRSSQRRCAGRSQDY